LNILFDQGTPVPLRRHLAEPTVDTVFEHGSSDLRNGALLDHAEMDGYRLLVTTDQNLRHQQNLNERTIAIMVLLAASWPRIQQRTDDISSHRQPDQAGAVCRGPHLKTRVDADHRHFRSQPRRSDLQTNSRFSRAKGARKRAIPGGLVPASPCIKR
jgi:hypothetical protein